MTKKRALVVCPGRGTYNKDELGYLARHHGNRAKFIAEFDALRGAQNQPSLSELDGAASYSLSQHTRGDNASALIYACALADFQVIDQNQFDIVAITGNSMGWYIALACAGALNAKGGFEVVNTMGTLMQEGMIGGQLVYPYVDEDWLEIPGQKERLLAMPQVISNLFISIDLGGMIVFAGDEVALKQAEQHLEPVQARFPMRLQNHAGFHSELQQPISDRGFAMLPENLFQKAKSPLIDGRGHVWYPGQYTSTALRDYTLGHQVVETYDFAKSIQNSVKEFAPDKIIVLGPGTTLGSSVAQSLAAINWHGIEDKVSFAERQDVDPYLLAMGRGDQRRLVTPLS